MVLMKDKMLLLNSWPFIVRHLKQTISHLQESASKVTQVWRIIVLRMTEGVLLNIVQ